MGQNEEEWTSLAAECEKAGASVIECNFSCPNMESDELGITIGQSEELIEKFTRATKKGTSLPVLANSNDLKGMHISGMGGIETWSDAMPAADAILRAWTADIRPYGLMKKPDSPGLTEQDA